MNDAVLTGIAAGIMLSGALIMIFVAAFRHGRSTDTKPPPDDRCEALHRQLAAIGAPVHGPDRCSVCGKPEHKQTTCPARRTTP